MTLRGPTIAQDFKTILNDYIDRRYGPGTRTAAE
jgi:(E)-4-hydroxy-3-methylbut-2-enyl-diphosphate synthase